MEREILSGVRDVIIDKDFMWIISDSFPCLFRYDFLKQELELVAVFPETMESGNLAFSKIIKLENEIYFIPRLAKDIYYYHIIENEFHELNISFDNFCVDKRMEVIIQGKYLYCINRFPNIVIKINSVTKEVSMFSIDLSSHIDAKIESSIYMGFQSPCIYQEKIIWSHYKNILVIFDTKKESFFIKKLEGLSHEKIERLQGVLEVEDYIIGVRIFEDILWLFSYEGKIYQYDEEIHKAESTLFDNYIHYDDIDNINYFFLYDIVPLKNELIMIPSYKNKCIKYNNETRQYEEVLDDYVQNWKGNERIYSLCKKLNDRKIILYSYYESSFYILDLENNSVCKRKITIPYAKFIKENLDFKQMVIKDGVYQFDNLNCLFESSIQDRHMDKKTLSDNTIGKQIFQTINIKEDK